MNEIRLLYLGINEKILSFPRNSIMQSAEVQLMSRNGISIGKKQVYIVDDDESICRALRLLVVSCGFVVRTFPSAQEFFSAVPNSSVGCLIMDIHMPGLNGLEAHQRLVKAGANRPVIIITADQNKDLKEKAIKTGAAGFLQKPIDNRELLALINQVS